VTGFYLAATVVTLLQFFRVRERRLLLLALLFGNQALAFSREWWDPWQRAFQIASAAAGLLLVVVLSPRPLPRP
jgi:hypothetical protein